MSIIRKIDTKSILEETGIIIETGEVIYVFEKVERDADGRVRFHTVIIDLLADYVGGSLQPGDDAEDACWVSREDLSILELAEKTRQLLRMRFGFPKSGKKEAAPSPPWWGFTAHEK